MHAIFRMKTSILLIILVSLSTVSFGQMYEVGISIGGSNYVGDIGSTSYIKPNRIAGAALFKYNLNPRIALRATYSYLPIEANDIDADTDYRRNRKNRLGLDENLYFLNTIHELSLGMEFNFFEYDLSSYDKTWTPYILLEAAAFNYSGLSDGSDITNKTSFAIPIGVGIKSKLDHTFAIAIETKFRYTFKDDLDFASEITRPDLQIEGASNDWYMYTGITLIYTFGRPACYNNRF